MSLVVRCIFAVLLVWQLGCPGGWGTPAPPDTPAPTDGIPADPLEISNRNTVTGTLEKGQTLTGMLLSAGVPPDQAHAAVRTLGDCKMPLRSLSVGNPWVLELDNTGNLVHFEYERSVGERYQLDGSPLGGFLCHREQAQVEMRPHVVTGTITNTLSESVRQAGEGMGLTALIVDVFQWDVNFYTETQKGDTFEVLYLREYVDGQPTARYDKVLAARYQGKTVGLKEVYFFEKEYFDPKGRFVRKGFLTAPLDVLRVTSRYGQRFHPILRQLKSHKGVDYGAPQGTPVWAVAAGKVVAAGDRGDGYGKKVVIDHAKGYRTLYAHLSSVSVSAGSSVRQKQMVGRVGRTGRATGAHLHFEVLIGNKNVDPGKIKLIPGDPIPTPRLAEFRVEMERLKAQLEALKSAQEEVKKWPRAPWGWEAPVGEGRL